MLSMSDTPVERALARFSSRGIEAEPLVPTLTGYHKSIMDAVGPLRRFLLRNGLHDYGAQPQGEQFKAIVPAVFVYADRLEDTKASLYRPLTKGGDPRICLYGLKRYCQPNNLLLLATADQVLYVFNMSDRALVDGMRTSALVTMLMDHLASTSSTVADELLAKLRLIGRLGPVRTHTDADTGVGHTLEDLLGIRRNSSRLPDYKGIEIKTARYERGRSSLFCKTPDWEASPYKGSEALLKRFGYDRDGRLKLYVTLKATKSNAQGLRLLVDERPDLLHVRYAPAGGIGLEVVRWPLDGLRAALAAKHRETFWVAAESTIADGKEFLHYTSAVYTRAPLVNLFGPLVTSGAMSVDFLIKELPNGSTKDKGYPFKIATRDHEALFPSPVSYSLIDF